MSDDGEDSEDSQDGEVAPAPFPDCPRCGEPVCFAVMTGPHTGTVEPCGCSVPPGPLERSRGD